MSWDRLIQIAAIAVVVSVVYGLFASPHPIHGHPPEIRVRKAASELEKALEFYRLEYQRFPEIAESNSDFSGETPPDLITALLAVRDHEATERLNRRRVQFFTARRAKKTNRIGIVKTSDGSFQLLDWWGQPYQLFLDTNEDGKIRIPKPNGNFRVADGQVFVISAGPDRVIGTKDDVFAE